MNTKNAFSTLLTVLITAVVVGVLTGVISYSYAISKKDFEIEDLKDQLSQVQEQASVEQESRTLDTSETNNQQPTTDSQRVTATPSTNTDATTTWETYTNDKYGFTIKYPDKEWEIRNINKTGEAIEIGFQMDDNLSFGATVNITRDNLKRLPINQYVDEMLREIKEEGATFSYQSKEEVIMGNNKGVKLELVKDPLYKDGIDRYYIGNQEDIFEINRAPESKISSSEKTINETLEQILSTFQFTK